MNDAVKIFLSENLPIKVDLETVLEKPKLPEHGDVAFPCFVLSKELKKNPVQIALDLEKQFQDNLPSTITKIDAIGPYLNFHLNPENEANNLLNEFHEGSLFRPKINQKQKILIEWPSPNTNKALHIGHSRNMLLGNAIYKILERSGHEVIKTNLNNDRGIAVCKAMLSYELFGDNSNPSDLNMRGDIFVSHWYTLYNEKNKDTSLELDKKSQEMLVLWEKGDTNVRNLCRKMLS